ncbi:hypothetical protein GDO86_018825 [Hymenochirus boettgeri]|uniref:Uncharacterized protein n=1 Tax=Hymenochirus boettgeri TaxID=247094 RepID=A0A8T2ILW9_9PIPI|nr:hypothetical protein GDO86_018825 [Hymenochirus boettgeri]
MEVLRADTPSDILSRQEEKKAKEVQRQALNLVKLLQAKSEGLVTEYLKNQGAPFSNPGFTYPLTQIEGLPVLDVQALPTSPWKSLVHSLLAYTSLTSWFAAIIRWQKSLNSTAPDFINTLEASYQSANVLSASLLSLLQEPIPAPPSIPEIKEVFTQKITGYGVCQCFCDWLLQTRRDMEVLVAETPV